MGIIIAVIMLSMLIGFWITLMIFALIAWYNETIIEVEMTEEDELEIWNCLMNN